MNNYLFAKFQGGREFEDNSLDLEKNESKEKSTKPIEDALIRFSLDGEHVIENDLGNKIFIGDVHPVYKNSKELDDKYYEEQKPKDTNNLSENLKEFEQFEFVDQQFGHQPVPNYDGYKENAFKAPKRPINTYKVTNTNRMNDSIYSRYLLMSADDNYYGAFTVPPSSIKKREMLLHRIENGDLTAYDNLSGINQGGKLSELFLLKVAASAPNKERWWEDDSENLAKELEMAKEVKPEPSLFNNNMEYGWFDQHQ